MDGACHLLYLGDFGIWCRQLVAGIDFFIALPAPFFGGMLPRSFGPNLLDNDFLEIKIDHH